MVSGSLNLSLRGFSISSHSTGGDYRQLSVAMERNSYLRCTTVNRLDVILTRYGYLCVMVR